MIGNSNDEANIPPKLLLTDSSFSKICKAFANNLSANLKLLKTQLSKIMQSDDFLEKRLGPLLKNLCTISEKCVYRIS